MVYGGPRSTVNIEYIANIHYYIVIAYVLYKLVHVLEAEKLGDAFSPWFYYQRFQSTLHTISASTLSLSVCEGVCKGLVLNFQVGNQRGGVSWKKT